MPIIQEGFFGDTSTPVWQIRPDEEQIKAIIERYRRKGQTNLTEGEVLLAHRYDLEQAQRKRLVERANLKEKYPVNPNNLIIGTPTFSP
jgi:hypothetical protein